MTTLRRSAALAPIVVLEAAVLHWHIRVAQQCDGNPQQQWLARRPPLHELLSGDDRPHAVALAHIDHGYSLTAIARELGCHY